MNRGKKERTVIGTCTDQLVNFSVRGLAPGTSAYKASLHWAVSPCTIRLKRLMVLGFQPL